ncbi:putative protein kinase RLK-Pelle-PERK-2 family [Helianthus annuus]|nr:putative protein kinase RLK-Pelle-PERK-2 family [Helianthus annuus]
MEELQCNVVIMKKSQPKVLRLSLTGSPVNETKPNWSNTFQCRKSSEIKKINKNKQQLKPLLLQQVRSISLSKTTPRAHLPYVQYVYTKAPIVVKPPRWFTYAELELATGGFSKANFLAEGGFGSVHRGILPDGQAVAVKQHKLASCQGDKEFCSEVEVLSCAQHRNVVMLIGFCVEDGKRLLVYEICLQQIIGFSSLRYVL